ncbi:MAG TPA: Ig-like domain-containing protein [Gemmatimonadales bacterium]
MRALLAITALAILAACQDAGSDGSPTAPEPELLMFLLSGNDQVAVPGEALGSPLEVQVRDGWGGAVAGVRVTWSVTSGHGAFNTPSPTVTGADGRTMASFTPSTARVELRAAIEGRAGSNVLFRTTPQLTAVYTRPSASSYCSPPGCESIAFYADHSFAIRYGEALDYFGTYSRNGPVVTLVFRQETWRAAARILGDSLLVEYNFDANMSGFEDGAFILKEGMPPQ